MNYGELEQIEVEFKLDAAFRVPVKRTAPTARRLPQQFFEPFFFSPEEDSWAHQIYWRQ